MEPSMKFSVPTQERKRLWHYGKILRIIPNLFMALYYFLDSQSGWIEYHLFIWLGFYARPKNISLIRQQHGRRKTDSAQEKIWILKNVLNQLLVKWKWTSISQGFCSNMPQYFVVLREKRTNENIRNLFVHSLWTRKNQAIRVSCYT